MTSYPELRKLQDIIDTQADRILNLETALREAIAVFESWHDDETEVELLPQLRAALDNLCEDEGCPNAGTPHVCINRQENAAGWPIEPKRQENDDVFPGFRGNNEA